MHHPPRPLAPQALPYLKYFDAAAKNLSFSAAAAELHLTRAAVSQQIKRLEELLGVCLFVRVPRGLRLTREGERLHGTVRRTVYELEMGLQAIQPGTTANDIAIRASPSFSMLWLMPRLTAFGGLYPELKVRLRSAFFGMSTAQMDAEEIDVLVIYGREAERREPHIMPLMSEYLMPVASQGYLDAHAPIADAARLARHTLLHDDSPWEGAPAFSEWVEWVGKATGVRSDAVTACVRHGHQYNLSQLAVHASILGHGVAMARVSLINDELRRGQLMPAIPVCALSDAGYGLVVNPNKRRDRSITIFTEWIKAECEACEKNRDRLLADLGVATAR